MMSNPDHENSQAREAWNANAAYWNERMADGNRFFEIVIWPAVERLLAPISGERLLDVACGNGLTSRRLARAGASVTAFDFSQEMIRFAKAGDDVASIEYLVLDATDSAALQELGTFDGVLANMALMDLANIRPLMTALKSLMAPGGRFVFSVVHPCFNNPSVVQVGEQEDRKGRLSTTYSIKVSRYLTPYTQLGLAMRQQPQPHPYFHRPLSGLLAPGFEAGLVLDGLEELAFPPEKASGGNPLSWSGGQFGEIPAALVGRMKHNAG